MKYASLAATLTSKKHKVGNGSVTFHCNWHFAYEEYKEWSRSWPFCLALSSQLGFLLNGILMVDAILLPANKLWFWLKPPLSYRSLKGCHAATFGYKSGFTDIESQGLKNFKSHFQTSGLTGAQYVSHMADMWYSRKQKNAACEES